MTSKTGKNRNTNDTAAVTTVEINSATSTTLVVANALRQFLTITADEGIQSIQFFIKLQPAADDNDAKGILLSRQSPGFDGVDNWVMSTDSVYTGEVSAITTGGTFDVHITEY